MMRPDELMMSDIPWAVAWYGGHRSVWLTVDDAETYANLNKLAPVKAIYLTQRTSDRRFLSQMLPNQHSWEFFLLDSLPERQLDTVPDGWLRWRLGEVPTGFPLKVACLDYYPFQMFISDRKRW